MVAIDTDVMLLAFAYHQDKRQKINDQFLNVVQSIEPASTIYNLMELLGQPTVFQSCTKTIGRLAVLAY